MDSKRAPDIYYERVSFLSYLLQETELTPSATECTPCHLELCILQHSDRTTSIREKKNLVGQTRTQPERKRPIKLEKMIGRLLPSGGIGKALYLVITTLSSSLMWRYNVAWDNFCKFRFAKQVSLAKRNQSETLGRDLSR